MEMNEGGSKIHSRWSYFFISWDFLCFEVFLEVVNMIIKVSEFDDGLEIIGGEYKGTGRENKKRFLIQIAE